MLKPSMRHLERRLDCRYGFDQPLLFSLRQHCTASLGAGHTIELGAGGLLFQSDCPPLDGALIQVEIIWPFLVQGVCSVVLVVDGRVVRTDARGTAVQMGQYLFQTADSRSFDCAIGSGWTCNLIG